MNSGPGCGDIALYSLDTSWIQAGYKLDTRSYLAHSWSDCHGTRDNVVACDKGYHTQLTACLYLFFRRRYSHFIAGSRGKGKGKHHISTSTWAIIQIQGTILEPLTVAIRRSFIHVNSFPGRRDMPLYLLDTRSGYKLDTRSVYKSYLCNQLDNKLVSRHFQIASDHGYSMEIISCPYLPWLWK